MCGIGGCVVPAGKRPSSERLEEMRTALAHRGPDADGIGIEGNVGLVHTRLAIVDPTPRGNQPMRHPGGRWFLTYNGEVFNHRELRRLLADNRFEGGSDTETVLLSLAEWGADAVPRFNGMFAFAAVDLDANRLLLVRDRLGVKPLYITWSERSLWFASEIGALLAAGVARRPERERVAQVIDVSFPDDPRTLIEGVERLPPGSLLSVDLESLEAERTRWYDPARAVNPERQAELKRRPRRELANLVEDELQGSVHRRLMADVPIGTMCSGGLDSSLVTAFAREARPDIVAFNVSIPGSRRQDERPAAARAAAALGVELASVEMTPSSWRAAFAQAVRHFEHPFITAGPVGVAQVAALARARGVKALLTGEGADELAGGYWGYHRDAFLEFLPRRHSLRRMIESARLRGPLGALVGAAQLAVGYRPPAARRLTSDRNGRVRPEILEGARAAYAHHSGARRELEAELLCDLSTSLPHLLNRWDKNAMQTSVEARVPFLDPGFVALLVNLPLEARVGPHNKGVLRDVARSHLPRSIAMRPKQPGMLFDARWITTAAAPSFLGDGYLRELLQVPLADWTELIGRARHSHAVRLWSTEVWCRLLLEAQPVADVERELWPNGP